MRGALYLLLAACAFAALATPARADEWSDDIEVIDDAEMDDLRGGFEIGGLEIGFGAVVTSTLNGTPILVTELSVTDTGAVVAQTLNNLGERLSNLTPAQLEALGLLGLEGLDGVVVNGESGITAFVHNVTNGTLQNIVVNTATGQDIRQDVDVTLTLPNFEYVQQQLTLERFGMRLSDDLQAIAIGAGAGG